MYGRHGPYDSIKKIRNYSYNPLDEIGKGFSSRVYKGLNEDNSTIFKKHDDPMLNYFYLLLISS
jgi:hypothetical protein